MLILKEKSLKKTELKHIKFGFMPPFWTESQFILTNYK
jgi:hypothetical protein